mmetsp:Transcript_15035/g.25857  ORF Transcript_15035/g.25857 Transcript_15035/m.25857 type:complete len:556 (+) Transcript_15035:19-1686(+)
MSSTSKAAPAANVKPSVSNLLPPIEQPMAASPVTDIRYINKTLGAQRASSVKPAHQSEPDHIHDDTCDVNYATVPVQTTLVCTIGPRTKSVSFLSDLISAGMSVARMNFSHGDHAYHGEVIDNLRTALASSSVQRQCALMLDTKGPEIRTGKLRGDKSSVPLTAGNKFVWHNDESRKNDGDENEMYCTYAGLATTVKTGSKILCSDALLSFTVISVNPEEKRVRCTIDNSGTLGNTKNMNLPNAKVDLPALTEKDFADITFGVSKDIDIIAASFIRKASDVEAIRNVPGVREKKIAIVSKIENQEGLDNFDAILEKTDGIMVARGDLGSEIPIEDVAAAQKMMIHKCNMAGKPVITATQMLDSMIKNPRPTRAEATDVFNAVVDGSDAVMLSGETANGDWPIEAVQTMARICRSAEGQLDHREYFMKLRSALVPPQPLPESLASTAVKSAWDLHAPLIVVVTESGATARLVSKYRPHCPILTITDKPKTANIAILSRGTVPYVVQRMFGTEEIAREAINMALQSRMCTKGDLIPVLFGRREGVSGSINAMKIVTV